MYTRIKRIFLLLLLLGSNSIKPMDSAMGIVVTLGHGVDLAIDSYYKPNLTKPYRKTFEAGQSLVDVSGVMNVALTIAMGFADYTLLKSNYYNPLCNALSWCIATGYVYQGYTKGAFILQDSKKLFAGGCISKMPIYIASCLFPRTIHSIFHMRSLLYA